VLTFWRPSAFEDSRAKIAGSHMALRVRNLGVESGIELFKGFEDAASLLVCTRKKFLLGGCGFFVSDVISGGFFRPP